ncbi:ABC transporter permease [Azospirillum tabaci]|uniref:ABC transporter permease n=1 Tax=Azospirillum tabaci TaxID=2752310 RepID=UPI0031B63D4F
MISGQSIKPASIGPLAMIRDLWAHRVLIGRLARRELMARYRGSMLGMVWAVLTPVMMLAVYTFVFRTVFKARWTTDASGGGHGEFALLLFAGLILFNVFAESVNRAPGLMLENVSYIKKVVFPLEILPAVVLVGALYNAGIGLVVLALFYGPVFGVPPWTVLLTPLVVVPLALLTLGVSWFLASAGVFLRDIRQFIGVAVTMLMFLSPIFYPASAIPEELRSLLALNPLVPILEQARGLLFWGTLPDWGPWLLSVVFSYAVAWLGYAWFVKTRKGFADVV